MMSLVNSSADRLLRVAPLGLYFRDVVSLLQGYERISVWAYPVVRPEMRTRAIMNARGIFAFPTLGRKIAGLEDAFARGQGWSEVLTPTEFVVEIDGQLANVVSYSLTAQLPMRELLTLPAGDYAPIDGLGNALPLFPAPSQGPLSGAASVRATLWDRVAGAPAVGAVLEVRLLPSGPIWRGISDESGRILVMFAYPPPVSPIAGEPVIPPLDRPWSIGIALRYAPAVPGPGPRHLGITLSQPYGEIWTDVTRTTHLTEAQLKFGEELVLRSRDGTDNPLPVLYVTPGATP